MSQQQNIFAPFCLQYTISFCEREAALLLTIPNIDAVQRGWRLASVRISKILVLDRRA